MSYIYIYINNHYLLYHVLLNVRNFIVNQTGFRSHHSTLFKYLEVQDQEINKTQTGTCVVKRTRHFKVLLRMECLNKPLSSTIVHPLTKLLISRDVFIFHGNDKLLRLNILNLFKPKVRTKVVKSRHTVIRQYNRFKRSKQYLYYYIECPYNTPILFFYKDLITDLVPSTSHLQSRERKGTTSKFTDIKGI